MRYRPPGTEIKIFSEHLQGILQSINSENKKCYLLGDYNINLPPYQMLLG